MKICCIKDVRTNNVKRLMTLRFFIRFSDFGRRTLETGSFVIQVLQQFDSLKYQCHFGPHS